jgi:CRISP-associated protein Cas1
MSIIYIVSDYGRLIKKGEVLELRKEESVLKTIFPFKTEQLVVMGKIEITSPALNFLMRHNIDTVFLSSNGRFSGKITFQASKNVFLRKRQFEALSDNNFRLKIAKAIVRGKLKNQLTFMQRINRKGFDSNILLPHINKVKEMIEKSEIAESLDSLRGYEGMAAKNYFSVFRHSIIQDWAVFNGRSMHPPKDNVNAVLSFLYTMVLFRVDSSIEAIGLDPYVGNFHSLNYGKRTLTFDLMEEFRVPLADTLTVALFNLGILNKDDFETVNFSTTSEDYPMSDLDVDIADDNAIYSEEKKGVLLTKDGIKKVLIHFEKKLETAYFYQPLLKSISYRSLIQEQAEHFKRFLIGQENEYKPLVIK